MAQQNGDEYAIAVNSTVRTLARTGQFGSEYTLTGVYTGTNYAYPGDEPRFFDGTTDGTFNYSVDFNSKDVYRFGLDWSNPTLLFAQRGYGRSGITYDKDNNTLWVADFFGTYVRQFTLTGDLVSSFNVPIAFSSCLALDAADDTLWLGSQSTMGTFYQYSKSGIQLSTVTYTNMIGQNTLGGEFAFADNAVDAPEPGTLALLGVTLFGGAGILRRKRK